jgi:hypothetical protein
VQRLLHAVETHAAAEADSLVEYRQLADTAADPVVALLMRLVLEDEERHHGLLRRMSASLNDSLRWAHSRNALPTMSEPPQAPMAQVVATVREFIRQEHEGVRHLKELARQSKRLNGGLDSLLLETMVLDSQKHERILRFILERLQTPVGSATGLIPDQ